MGLNGPERHSQDARDFTIALAASDHIQHVFCAWGQTLFCVGEQCAAERIAADAVHQHTRNLRTEWRRAISPLAYCSGNVQAAANTQKVAAGPRFNSGKYGPRIRPIRHD